MPPTARADVPPTWVKYRFEMTNSAPTERGDLTRDEYFDLVFPQLVARMQPGTQWRTPTNRRLHVLAVVDEEYIVVKEWFVHKRRWSYRVEWVYGFWLWDRDGKLECLTPHKRKD